MDNENTSLEDLLNTERDLVLGAEEAYGEYFTHAAQLTILTSSMVASMEIPMRFLFVAFLSHVKKHLLLALFSAVRRHQVQAGMNLRQVLEAGAWAAYALAHQDLNLFRTIDQSGRLDVPRSLSDARNQWLTNNYPAKSEEIRRLKIMLNESTAHAKIEYVFNTFAPRPRGQRGFTTTFFDEDDEYRIKMNLLLVANFAMGMIQLFTSVNMNERVFRFPDAFVPLFRSLSDQHER